MLTRYGARTMVASERKRAEKLTLGGVNQKKKTSMGRRTTPILTGRGQKKKGVAKKGGQNNWAAERDKESP